MAGHPGVYKAVSTLVKNEQSGKESTIETDEGDEPIDGTAALNLISSEPARKGQRRGKRLFVSYSRKDEDMFDLFVSRNLAALEMNGLISAWHDTKVPLGEDWDGMILRELEESDIMLCLVSTPFLVSKYIREKEIPLGLKLHHEGKLTVIPVVLEDAPSWRTSELHAIQGILPDGKPVRFNEWRPEDAFNIVEAKLRELLG